MRRLVQVCLLSLAILVAGAAHSTAADAAAANRKACPAIEQEFRRQGASRTEARWFAYTIGWRESGCVMQCVSDSDDYSCSRFGINFKNNGRAHWGPLCGAWDRTATKSLRVDVKCAHREYVRRRGHAWRR